MRHTRGCVSPSASSSLRDHDLPQGRLAICPGGGARRVVCVLPAFASRQKSAGPQHPRSSGPHIGTRVSALSLPGEEPTRVHPASEAPGLFSLPQDGILRGGLPGVIVALSQWSSGSAGGDPDALANPARATGRIHSERTTMPSPRPGNPIRASRGRSRH